jgi:hypothetical protein
VALASAIQCDVRLTDEGRIVDVGLGGVRLEHQAVLRPGQPCILRFKLEDQLLAFRSRVMWSRALDRRAGRHRGDLMFQSGLAFESMPGGARRLLAELVGDSRTDEN